MKVKEYRYFSKETYENNIRSIIILRMVVLYNKKCYKVDEKLHYSINSNGYIKHDYISCNEKYQFDSIEFNNILNEYTELFNFDLSYYKLKNIYNNHINS